MGQEMPSLVKCSQCPRTFPVRAQMQLEGKSLPMLVVLPEVDSVEEALAQATCQMCLGKTGTPDRGLYEVLKRLGLKDEDKVLAVPREAVVAVRPTLEVPARTGSAVVVASRPREVTVFDPLMGTSIERPCLALPARTRGPRRDDWRQASSEPRLPSALRTPEHHDPLPKVEPLTGTIRDNGGNAAVLEVAMKAAKVRDEAKRLERAKALNKLMFYLTLALGRIRKNAATSEVWDLVETFERKIGEAASLDAQQRGKKGLLKTLGTSEAELEALCLQFYLGKAHTKVHSPEIVSFDAFEGGRRPETWDSKGGRKPAFYQFEVVRTKNSLPVPNPPLPGGDEDPHPRIVYPEGGDYGSDYTVEHSRHLAGVEAKIDAFCEEAIGLYARWLVIARDDIGIGTELTKFDFAAHIPAFFADLKQALADEVAELAAGEAASKVDDPANITSPDLPANT